MANTFNIRELTAQAHGYIAPPFPLLGVKRGLPDVNKIGKSIVGRTHLGVPYFMDVVIDGVRLPNEPLITFNGQKRIVQTSIVGSERRGTVKELISSNDYRIRIEGVCIEAGKKEYPQHQVEQLIALCEKPASLEFENELAEMFGIHKLAITSYAFDKMQGKPYSQKYVINAVSDEDFYAELKGRMINSL
ncbi:DUF6046 domain-containing protein [Tenacibaculum maritimum]|uniref:DUF6046 domain-containing protein n=2 Tax=Tenacibaculum maritimum TaxID=107401 RepID=UPI0012E44E1C|nr:DUF6046 domain-containing protein [Tenacibaculum maritimum]CAA0253663.1 conserved hypothetical protein [Tenacibaculum maritimum]